jgi:hypothetical protein
LRAQSTRLSSKQPNNVSTSSADVALSALKWLQNVSFLISRISL